MPDSDLQLHKLLRDCAGGNHEAFARLYQTLAPRLFTLCRYMLRNEELAQEALQESFLQIWRDAANFNPQRSAPVTWVSVIARHRCLDLLRRQRPEQATATEQLDEQLEDGPGPLELTLRASEKHALTHCLQRLSEQQRISITLAFYHGLTHQQLSDRLTAPIGTVKSWIRRGLERLKRCLRE